METLTKLDQLSDILSCEISELEMRRRMYDCILNRWYKVERSDVVTPDSQSRQEDHQNAESLDAEMIARLEKAIFKASKLEVSVASSPPKSSPSASSVASSVAPSPSAAAANHKQKHSRPPSCVAPPVKLLLAAASSSSSNQKRRAALSKAPFKTEPHLQRTDKLSHSQSSQRAVLLASASNERRAAIRAPPSSSTTTSSSSTSKTTSLQSSSKSQNHHPVSSSTKHSVASSQPPQNEEGVSQNSTARVLSRVRRELEEERRNMAAKSCATPRNAAPHNHEANRRAKFDVTKHGDAIRLPGELIKARKQCKAMERQLVERLDKETIRDDEDDDATLSLTELNARAERIAAFSDLLDSLIYYFGEALCSEDRVRLVSASHHAVTQSLQASLRGVIEQFERDLQSLENDATLRGEHLTNEGAEKKEEEKEEEEESGETESQVDSWLDSLRAGQSERSARTNAAQLFHAVTRHPVTSSASSSSSLAHLAAAECECVASSQQLDNTFCEITRHANAITSSSASPAITSPESPLAYRLFFPQTARIKSLQIEIALQHLWSQLVERVASSREADSISIKQVKLLFNLAAELQPTFLNNV